MRLMTREIEKALERHPIYSQDGKGDAAEVVVKYFGGSAATWLITEGERQGDDWLLYGKATLGLSDPLTGGILWEWGYVLLSQLQSARFGNGLGVERDMWVGPGDITVAEGVAP